MALMFCECVVLYRNINKEKICYFVLLVDLFCQVYFVQCTENYFERTILKNKYL